MEKNMKVAEMLTKMTNTTAFTTMINKCIGGNKTLGWADMHNRKPSELVGEIMQNLNTGETILITDWCFDKYTLEAFIGISKHCDENNISYLMSLEDRLIVICKDEEDSDNSTIIKIATSLPKDVMMNTLITSVEEGIDSCAIHYLDHIKVLEYDVRPKFIYENLEAANINKTRDDNDCNK